jgi:HK97 family phage portal protein
MFAGFRRALARLLDPEHYARRAISADAEWLGSARAKAIGSSGVPVDEEIALGEVTIFACVRAIALTVASLPRGVFRHLEPRGKERQKTHPVARVIRRPNDWMNPVSFWATVVAQAAFRGEGYAQIVRDRADRPIELWPLPITTRPTTKGGALYYEVVDGTTKRTLEARNVLHFRLLTADGVTAYKPIELAAESVGLALAAERFAGSFFGNGSNLSGVLTHPGQLSDPAKQGMKKSWKELYSGVDNAHDVAILEEGVKFERIGIEPEKSQLNETLERQVQVMARLIGVPPHMIGSMEHASYATVEQQNIAFAVHTVRPWLVSIESESNFKLFDQSEDDLFLEHNMDGLLRGDFQTRMAGYSTAIQNGIYCVDEVRDKENENPLPDAKGTDYFHQSNMMAVPAGGLAAAQAAAAAAKLAGASGSPSVPSMPMPMPEPAPESEPTEEPDPSEPAEQEAD